MVYIIYLFKNKGKITKHRNQRTWWFMAVKWLDRGL